MGLTALHAAGQGTNPVCMCGWIDLHTTVCCMLVTTCASGGHAKTTLSADGTCCAVALDFPAGSKAGHDFVPMETHTEASNGSMRTNSDHELRLLKSQSENVGGVRAMISNKLGSTLSYSTGGSSVS